jgi:asparagine synthase (glutamine-hydrolysing)
MCGIVGMVGIGAAESQAPALERMIKAQVHRGPDGEGRWLGRVGERAVALGSSRLAILDLSPAGHQPMLSPSGRQVLVYNGEVYNYRELRIELEAHGVRFRGHSDTEVVMHSLLRWREAAPRRFNGMWALAWLDLDHESLFLSRDPFGIKPLYLYEGPRALYFASEIKSILVGSGERFPIDAVVVGRYLRQALLNAQEQTFFSGIESFPAGQNMSLDLRSPGRPERRVTRYWLAPARVEARDIGETHIETVRETFIDAVRLRLRSDVPVGVLLSGGVDSSSIAVAMKLARNGSDGLLMISGVSDDPRFSEEPFIDRMTGFLRCPAHKVRLHADRAYELLCKLTWFNDEPIGSLSTVVHHQLMEKAGELGVKVILSGQGADELLCGYDKYLGFYLQSLVREGAWMRALRVLMDFAHRGTVLNQFRMSEAKRYLPRIVRQGEIDIRGPALREGNCLLNLGLGDGDLMERQLADITRLSIPALVHYEDRMSMACSREIRLPFLDPRVVDILLPLPPEWKLRGGWTKWVLRRAMERDLPQEIIWRKDKQAFTNPQSEWLKRDLRERVSGLLAGDLLIARSGLVDLPNLRLRYEAYCAQPAERGRLSFKDVFMPIALEIWARQFEGHLRLD